MYIVYMNYEAYPQPDKAHTIIRLNDSLGIVFDEFSALVTVHRISITGSRHTEQ